jgi:hypothetical protein
MAELARERRQELINPAPHRLAGIAGTSPDLIEGLVGVGIRNVQELRAAAAAPDDRGRLAARFGEGLEDLYEVARFMEIRGVGNVRGRLYRNCVGTLESLAAMEPDQLITNATRFIDSTGFAGVPPTPKEAAYTVTEARRLTSYSS